MGASHHNGSISVAIPVDWPIQRGIRRFRHIPSHIPDHADNCPYAALIDRLEMLADGVFSGEVLLGSAAADQNNIRSLPSLIFIEGASFEDGKPDCRKIIGIRAAQHEIESLA